MSITLKISTSSMSSDLQVPLLNNQKNNIPTIEDNIPLTVVEKVNGIIRSKINYESPNAIIMHKFFHWPVPNKTDLNCPFCLEEIRTQREISSETEEQISPSNPQIDHKYSIQTQEDRNNENDEENRISRQLIQARIQSGVLIPNQDVQNSDFDSSSESSQNISVYVARSRGSTCKCLKLYARKNKCCSTYVLLVTLVFIFLVYAHKNNLF